MSTLFAGYLKVFLIKYKKSNEVKTLLTKFKIHFLGENLVKSNKVKTNLTKINFQRSKVKNNLKCNMGSGCCKDKVPRENEDAIAPHPQIEESTQWQERTRTVDDIAVLEVDQSFPKDTIEARREQILRDIGSFDLLSKPSSMSMK